MGGAIIILADGSHGHIRGTGIKPCASCPVIAEYLCDYPMRRGKTCDAPLCRNHAIVQGRRLSMQLMLFDDGEIPPEEAVHFCPAHHLIAGKRK